MHFVKEVTCVSEYRLRVMFEDGVVKIVDMKPYLDEAGSRNRSFG